MLSPLTPSAPADAAFLIFSADVGEKADGSGADGEGAANSAPTPTPTEAAVVVAGDSSGTASGSPPAAAAAVRGKISAAPLGDGEEEDGLEDLLRAAAALLRPRRWGLRPPTTPLPLRDNCETLRAATAATAEAECGGSDAEPAVFGAPPPPLLLAAVDRRALMPLGWLWVLAPGPKAAEEEGCWRRREDEPTLLLLMAERALLLLPPTLPLAWVALIVLGEG